MKSILCASLLLGCALLSGTVAFAEDAKPTALFNGRDLAGWQPAGKKGTAQWAYGTAALDPAHANRIKSTGPGTDLINPEPGLNLTSEASFGDCRVELEFMVPHASPGNSVDSNSGIKLMNIYEIQIFDSFGKAMPGKVDCGAVYSETAPAVNACKPAGEWQTLVIEFRAPRFDAAGKKTENAKFVKVILNGKVVQDNVEIAHGTNVSRNAPEHPTGPLYLQGDHGSVAFRNLQVTALKL